VKPRLLKAFAWTCLLLCAAITILWVRSYWAVDSLGRRTLMPQLSDPGMARTEITCGRGGIGYIANEDKWPAGINIWAIMGKEAADWNGRFAWRVSPDPPQYPFGRFPPHQLDWLGFFVEHFQMNVHPPWATDGSQLRSRHLLAVVVPFWFLFLIIAIWPALYFIPHIIRRITAVRRLHLRLCSNCGYDLRATPDRCPECGTVPPK
jgi:hypothetical protein